MGTHPIFESDFDCLTELSVLPKCQLLSHHRPSRSTDARRLPTPSPPASPARASSRSTASPSSKLSQRHSNSNSRSHSSSSARRNSPVLTSASVLAVVVASPRFTPSDRLLPVDWLPTTRNMLMSSPSRRSRIFSSHMTVPSLSLTHVARSRRNSAVQAPVPVTRSLTVKSVQALLGTALFYSFLSVLKLIQ